MYKDKIATDIQTILDEFFKQEFGNKLTVYNMKGLVMEINNALLNNQEEWYGNTRQVFT